MEFKDLFEAIEFLFVDVLLIPLILYGWKYLIGLFKMLLILPL